MFYNYAKVSKYLFAKPSIMLDFEIEIIDN